MMTMMGGSKDGAFGSSGEVEVEVEAAFIGVGCNRVVGAVAWGPCNLVAFAAHHVVAIFSPQTAKVLATLPGHKDLVNCVEWILCQQQTHSDSYGVGTEEQFLLSGSADGAIFLWAYFPLKNKWRSALQVSAAHEKAVTCIAVYPLSASSAFFASTSSDGTVRLWQVSLSTEAGGECNVTLLQVINVGTRVMTAVTLACFPKSSSNFLLAMGGLDNQIHLYAGSLTGQFAPVCHLKGHQDWIRGLDFSKIVEDADSGPSLFLASAAQDRIIRLWKITRRKVLSIEAENQSGPTLKMYIEGPIFKAGGNVWQVSLESLLVGHEDWVYSVRWQPPQADVVGHDDAPSIRQQMCVLSASMDRTMMIWKPDLKSGIWMNVVTVGELGHTALGFYGGVWSPQANAILAHGYGGSLHLWCEIGHEESQWRPQVVPSGHSGPVVDVSWGKNGLFLLSASHDQTTRLFACWKRKEGGDEISGQSWHEIARPQVHGHDLNCLVVVQSPGNHCYVSGADEKVARVFEGPRAFIDSLAACTGVRDDSGFIREDIQIMGANMSALGLSQKPIYSQGIGASKRESEVANLDTMEALPDAVPMVLTEPPLEEHLAHHTLWPESHKLYGHGNELFAMCCDHVGKILATACKAQSASVAEIWLWHIDSWRVAGQLRSHTLTVTQMEFSHNNRFLLSVSRDRHLSIYQRVETGDHHESPYKLLTRVEGHKRIIWACSWSHCDQFFATGSRDKTVKVWEVDSSSSSSIMGCSPRVQLAATLPVFKSSITALSWAPFGGSKDSRVLAIGREDGLLELWKGSITTTASSHGESGSHNSVDTNFLGKSNITETRKLDMSCFVRVDANLCHVATVHRLTWRDIPIPPDETKTTTHVDRRDELQTMTLQLASAGADHSTRIFDVKFTY